jgi:hypothetical protein
MYSTVSNKSTVILYSFTNSMPVRVNTVTRAIRGSVLITETAWQLRQRRPYIVFFLCHFHG